MTAQIFFPHSDNCKRYKTLRRQTANSVWLLPNPPPDIRATFKGAIVLAPSLSLEDPTMSDATIIVVESIANQQDIAAVGAMLNDYNVEQGLVYNPQSLSVFIRDSESGRVIAGLKGSTHWEWLRIKLLAVHKAARKKGFGTKLLEAAEKEAIERGCKYAFVDTYSFQALPFYKKCGYEVFGELPEYPHGHSRLFMRKELIKR